MVDHLGYWPNWSDIVINTYKKDIKQITDIAKKYKIDRDCETELPSHGRSWKNLRKNIKNNTNKFLCFTLKLIIRGENIDFDLLTSLLEITPTDTYKWNGSENEEKLDAWYYRVKISSIDCLESISIEFFSMISDVGIKLENFNTLKPEIVFHVHADMAQVYFNLPQSMIVSLEKLKIPFGISILSWGMVEN